MAEAKPAKKPTRGVLPPDSLVQLKGDMGIIHTLCFPTREYINNCSILLAGSNDGFIHFWNLNTNRRSHKQHVGGPVFSIHSIEDDLITQERTGTVKLWTLQKSNYKLMKTIETSVGHCKSILVNTELVVPQEKSMLDVIDVANMERTRTLKTDLPDLGNVMCLTNIEITGKEYILGAYESGHLILWDFDTAKVISQIKLIEQTMSISYDPLTSKGIAGNTSCVLQVFHIDRDTLQMSIKYETSIINDGVNVIKIRDDGKVFVAGCWDNRIRYFSWKTLRVLAVLTEHKKPITDLKFSPLPVLQWGSTVLAAASEDSVISLWNLYM